MTGSPTPIRQPFDPSKHLSRVNGNAYLEVEHRIAWFRDRYPDGQIVTDLLELGPDSAIFRATVTAITEGGVVCGRATGHGSETAEDFRDHIEKAETKAIGRALAALGFGTQFVVNHEGRPVDAPVPMPQGRRASRPASPTTVPETTPPAQPETSGDEMTPRQKLYLESVAQAAGLDANQLDDLAVQRFNTAYRWLSRQHASALITELQQRKAAS